MEFDLDGATYRCGKGQAIFVPRNTWHRFRTTSSEAATMLFFNFPGGLEEMFLAVAAAEAEGISDEQQLLSIVTRYGVDVRKPA
jgi:mannose-6-phosphate isomerase-like protein (cupin superfamily)